MSDEKKKKPTVPQRIIGWFKDALEWLRETLTDEAVRKSVYEDIGLKAPKEGEPDPLADLKKKSDENLNSIERYQKLAEPDKLAFLSAVGDIHTIGTGLVEVIKQLKDEGGQAGGEEAAHRFFRMMTANYLRLRYPFVYWLGQPLGFIEESISSHGSGNAYPERIVNFLRAPFDHLKPTGWPPETEDDARELTGVTLSPLGAALASLELFFLKSRPLHLPGLKDRGVLMRDFIFGWDASPVSTTPLADRIADRTLTFSLSAEIKDGPGDTELEGSTTVTMVWVPTEHGGPGLLVALGGAAAVEFPIGAGWQLSFRVDSASAVDFLIWKSISVNGPSDARLSVKLERPADPSDQPHAFPDRKGTRLEFQRVALEAEIASAGAGIRAAAHKCAFILCGGDGDGFIESILPAGETRIDFDLVLGLSTLRGFYIEGGTGLQALIPIARSLGPLRIHNLLLGLVPKTDPKPARIDLEVSAALGLKLGPFQASVDQVGFRSSLVFDGNGSPDLDFGYKPPNGIGLAIDAAGTVTGGGYLFFDAEKEQYAGVVQLDFKDRFALKAIGLLTTRMPDGSKGFSLLLIISAEDFTPIGIGFGFTLNGVGGLLGVNRTVAVDVLRKGLKSGTLDAVLFPEDPVRNAPQIVSNLRAIFPPARDQYVVGPMAKIGWGTPTLLTIDLGIVLEFPSPTRLVILGQFRALLPSKDKTLIKLQMDALGVIDFDKGEASLDATLHDSRVLQYSMTGDMALRARWEQDPTFLLAVGGFNPRFPAPAGFPTLARVAVNLTKGKNPRVRLEAYFALTSNTVQLGARADLFFGFSSFSVEGYLTFDALFQFSPFRFITDFSGGVALKWKGHNLAGIHLKATLSGPTPWHVRGEAKFSIWIWDKTVTVDKTFGSDEKPALPPPVDPLPLLRTALGDKRNWRASLPASRGMVVSLRQLPPSGDIFVHPLGELSVSQRVVPLNLDIAKFGNTRPGGAARFSISAVKFEDAPAGDVASVRDHFAPAEFLEMTDQEKLSRPSFEKMESGVSISTQKLAFHEPLSEDLDYETIIIDEKGGEARPAEPFKMPERTFDVLVTHATAARSALRTSGRRKFQAPSRGIVLRRDGFVVASTADLKVKEDVPGIEGARVATFTEAKVALQKFVATHPRERGRWQILNRHAVRE